MNEVNMESHAYLGTLGMINRYYQNQRSPTNIRILKHKHPTNPAIAGLTHPASQMIRTSSTLSAFSAGTTIYDPISKKSYRIVQKLHQAGTGNNLTLVPAASQFVLARGRKMLAEQNNMNSSSESEGNVHEYTINLDSESADEVEMTPVSRKEDKTIDSTNEEDSGEVTELSDDCSFKITNVVTLSPSKTPAPVNGKRSRAEHIKRPLNAFMAFSKVERRRIMNDDPMLHHAAVSKKLGTTWKALSTDQKKPYYDEARKLAEDHLKKYPNYKYQPRPKRVRAGDKSTLLPRAVNTYPPANSHNVKSFTMPYIYNDVQMAESINSTAEELHETQSVKPEPERNASGFHSWSLIYESSEEEEEEGEEEEDDD